MVFGIMVLLFRQKEVDKQANCKWKSGLNRGDLNSGMVIIDKSHYNLLYMQ